MKKIMELCFEISVGTLFIKNEIQKHIVLTLFILVPGQVNRNF